MGERSKRDMTQDEWLKKSRLDCFAECDLKDGKYDNKAIGKGLDIKNYPVKWRQARDLAIKEKSVSTPKSFFITHFDLACKNFLELGGQTIEQGL